MLLIHHRVVPMDIGRFFFKPLLSLCSAVKYWDPKCQVVVGDNWLLFVVMSIIFRNMSRYVCTSFVKLKLQGFAFER